MGSIGDMLNNVPEPEAATEEPEVIEAQPETVERPRGPDGKFISKETGVETPPVAEAIAEPVPPTEPTNQLPRDVYEPLKAIRDENKELKAAIAELQRRAAPQPQVQLTQEQEADFWDNPQAFMAQMTGRLRGQILEDLRQEQRVERLNTSETAAKAKYPDYQEKFAAFEQAVQLNPRLAQELAQAPDPGEFAYSRGKTALEIERHGSIDALLAAERQKWEAEAKAQFQPRQTLPSTTAADGSVGARAGPEWAGPASLTQMLG